MKRFIIIIFILWVNLTLFSQARIGFSLNNIKTEFSAYKMKYMVTEGIPCLSIQYCNVEVLHYFDNKNICYQTSIVTNNLILVKNIINVYNKYYVTKSKTSWLMMDKFIVIDITLKYLPGIGYVFIWN